MTDAPRWITPDALAARSGIPVETIRHHCRAGNINGAERAGRSWIIPTLTAKIWADNYIRYGSLRRVAGPEKPPPGPAVPAANPTPRKGTP